MTTNTGGPAFPAQVKFFDEPTTGMTLRDYFAAKAMASLGFTTKPYDTTAETAKKCYQMADAMLRARELT